MAKVCKSILFSCLGSSDPVRDFHDGSMLHIVRHYRPDKILWYITGEMRKLEEKDDRYRKSICCLKRQYPGYEPEILSPYYDDISNVSDFDAFYEPFYKVFKQLTADYPDAEILVNISSGTPQMKMTLALLGSEPEFKTRCVQVINHEKCASHSMRAVQDGYNVDVQLANNADNDVNAVNRCVEPKLFIAHREKLAALKKSI